MSGILKVQKLVKNYDGKPVVKGISFDVERGEIFGILGPNGAGKTTTLEMIEALRPIDGGVVILDGINVAEDPTAIRRIIGVQPQSPDGESAWADETAGSDLPKRVCAAGVA